MKSNTKLLHGMTRKPVKMLTKSEGYRVQGQQFGKALV
jgi:hypothetical protein